MALFHFLLGIGVWILYWISPRSTRNVNKGNVFGIEQSQLAAPLPTNIAPPGVTRAGALPFRAEYDKLNVSGPIDAPIELRWNANGNTARPIHHNWGTASPYHPATELFTETHNAYVLPEQCHITQVHLLYRHGARYPVHGRRKGPGNFGKKIKKARRRGTLVATGSLEFLNTWKYRLGRAQLVPFGAQEMFSAGVDAHYAYGALLGAYDEGFRPVVRTTSQSRMLDSARYWTLGFFGWDACSLVNIAVIPEAPGYNNTLSPKHTCPGRVEPARAQGSTLSKEWRSIYLREALQRLQADLGGITLTHTDVTNMMQLCAFETLALGFSEFCRLFTYEEWEGFEYDTDIHFQSEYGFTPRGRALGIGWVTEFAERLAQARLDVPPTTQNTTLNSDPRYFPLDQPLYADFTHDTVLMSVISALNLTQLSMNLDATQIDHHRTFRTSNVTPFGARMAWEVISCGRQRYIRLLLNGVIVPLNSDQGCAPRTDGLCELDKFLQHITQNAYPASRFVDVCIG